ncbi:hypothetical protein BV22DRAFT_1054224 [Leucogyrophana mollusca]|uniref:Uncharacterized protein n=1 Tax=Leucogyrophana mollusca TaxID=85980 RepID=A0ACB8C1E2_9AGAM|nr:hypothetical protein BV22DRAFT_1054224 [Leucogyrophana mollusca]
MVLESQADPPKGARRAKERDPAQPTDLAERMIAFQRRNAAATRPRERVDKPPPSPRPLPPTPNPPPPPPRHSPVISSPRKAHQQPHLVVSRPEADPEDFSRRLKISSPPRQPHSRQQQQSKLFNPDTDPVSVRRTAEPESIYATSSSYVPRNAPPPAHQRDPPAAHQRLFDHRKDDPVRFSVLARPSSTNGARPTPTPKSSGDYVSASSTSSYAHSTTSSFTLSSGTTDNSSASSALFEGKPWEDPSNNAFAVQLKKLYRNISTLESKILNEDTDDNADDGRVLLHGRGREISDEELEQQKWMKLISDHKELADMMHTLMNISLAASVPASLRVIPTKYNIIIRLWTHAFHKLLEALRRASFSSPLALEHLQDFIYFAYTFYTGLLEEPSLRSFRAGWLEALGDLARYRMAVAAMVTSSQGLGTALTTDAVSQAAADAVEGEGRKSKSRASVKSSSDRPAARIDDSPSPSVGIAAARLLDVEPEKERWRGIAREWYAQGLVDTPGTGKLHHHLGLLSREVESEELRAVYHFIKSMTTLHPFSTSRESILPIWSSAAQARRSLPDARVTELFILLHGMLFTNIQLDDFQPTLARFLERLEIEGAEERDWIMMAVINIGGILEYGKPSGLLKKVGGTGSREFGPSPVRVVAKRGARHDDGDEKRMDVDDEYGRAGDDDNSQATATTQMSPVLSEAGLAMEFPVSLKLAMQLAFSMLSFVLRHPTRKPSPFAHSTLNPYIGIILTFISTVTKHAETLAVLERSIPWDELAQFFSVIPRNVLSSQGLLVPAQNGERWAMLTSGSAPPLPEDWCLRGMEWVGRKVFERGYWKSGEERRAEIEVLDFEEGGQLTDGIIEDEDDDEEGGNARAGAGETNKRWARVARCPVGLSQAVGGLTWVDGTREWRVEGALEAKVRRWREEDCHDREVEERRRLGRRWTDDAMDVDAEDDEEAGESSEDDEGDSEEVKALKARRRYLRSLLASAHRVPTHPRPTASRSQRSQRDAASRPLLNIVAGYTILVMDTNILLSSLSMISSIIESLRWTVVLPVPVIMELDGLSSNASQLGEAAQEAVSYITSHIRSHSTSLKVQTSKGNYLTSLSIRTEQVDFTDEESWDRSMDDLILKAAIWQDEHWVDRSALLKPAGTQRNVTDAVKVVLLSLDRNLRLKARSRQLPAAGEKDLAAILASGT